MMNYNPSSKIYLCNIGLYNDYKNVLTFANKNKQISYFQSIANKTYLDYSFVQEESAIYVEDNVEELQKYNYLFFQNSKYTNKWFYCFITSIEYENENTTKLTIEIDAFTTWQFDIQYHKCFVEREHVIDDTIGKHTIPEELQLGDYVIYHRDYTTISASTKRVVIGTTMDTDDTPLGCNIYTGIPTGVTYLSFDIFNSTSDWNALDDYLEYANNREQSPITGIFLAPEWLTGTSRRVQMSNNPKTYTMSVSNIENLDGYTPVNNKLFTYPYCYYLMTNGQGGSAIYKNEFWGNYEGGKKFKIWGCLTPGCSVRGLPINYKKGGIQGNASEGINLGKFPQLNFSSDQYTNWLRANGLDSMYGTFDTETTLEGGASSIAMALINPYLGIANFATTLFGAWKEHDRVSKIPPQITGNTNCGDVNVAMNDNDFVCYGMTITKEYAQAIDKYFTLNGYKVNDVKVPNISTRSNFNYVKTIGANMSGNIPQEDLLKIRNAFDNGVTIWHNPNSMYAY